MSKAIQKQTRLLIVDDDQHLLQSMGQWLETQGFAIQVASNVKEAKTRLANDTFDVALIDLRLGDEDGFELLEFCKNSVPQMVAILMTGYANIDTGVEAMRRGAADLLTKPLIDDELLMGIERAMSQRQVVEENRNLKAQLDHKFDKTNIVGTDFRMQKIFDMIDNIANTKATVLITGESGTGKSLIARAIHQKSNRKDGPFVEVACGALPENLLESELFGHVAGSFTGATANKEGKFQQAHGGTIFLDEIGTASPGLQVKLLRVLQEFEFEQVGGTKTFRTDARVVLATNEDLEQCVAENRFRQDLYYRINVINLLLPSLRERPSDVPMLAMHFLKKVCQEEGRSLEGFNDQAIHALRNYDWPGNVRELQNVVERAVLLGKGPELGVSDLPSHVGTVTQSSPQISVSATGKRQTLKEALEGPERVIILQCLQENNWNRNETADQLGINRTTLYKKMKKLGLDTPEYAQMIE
ncbi:sigma-54-dependent transcriptional regulator [Mariniblastus fucicola]|uniref:Transcriptional regulatory protein ZraR n=1 Tax=Mariniblastus fucicola TaxID=980251 RepID=A0A5B9P8U5_9BACT|nr:sigma-54 dependent transcriptional regulator [Mariniblastus fucicola]QEG21342.1 Transcriptional regulatory protein ZraR [Mariniblastus fucicola]